MAVEYTYRGEEGERIHRGATHVTVTAKVVRARAFREHPNIEEVICHEDVEKIEEDAFYKCPRLRKVVMSGVLDVEKLVFYNCPALTDVECGKLEIIGEGAFGYCKSLSNINLPSARIVRDSAFENCKALTSAKFSEKLESIEGSVFYNCISLERITIPLKNGIITHDNIFQECDKLKHVDLVEGEALRKTAAALQFDIWRNGMNGEIDSINQTLPDTPAGYYLYAFRQDDGEKARVIREWIERVLHKINHYKAEHRHVLDKAAAALQHALPQDTVMNNVLPFLELPPHTFEM